MYILISWLCEWIREKNQLGQRCFGARFDKEGVGDKSSRSSDSSSEKDELSRRKRDAKKNNGWHEKYVFVQMKLRKMNCRQFVVLIGSDVVVLLLPMLGEAAVQEWKEKCNFNVLYPFWTDRPGGVEDGARLEANGWVGAVISAQPLKTWFIRKCVDNLVYVATFYGAFQLRVSERRMVWLVVGLDKK